MKNIKVIDKNTGEEKNVKVNASSKSKDHSFSKRMIIMVIVLILVVPMLVTAINFILNT